MAALSRNVTLVEFNRSLVPAKWEDSVRVIGMSECKEAGLSLAHSFAADDLAQYLLNSDDMADMSAEDKWKLHVDIMQYTVAATALCGVVTTIGPDYDGVALWIPPGKTFGNWWHTIRSGMWRLWFQLSVEGKQRFFEELLPLLHDTKQEVLGERDGSDYYLLYLGTKPSARGRGYAKKLLEHMFEKADAEARPMYLESSAAANNVYYKKFGFELKKDIHLGTGDPAPVNLSIMVREPQSVRKITHSSAVVKIQTGRKM